MEHGNRNIHGFEKTAIHVQGPKTGYERLAGSRSGRLEGASCLGNAA